MSPKFFRTTIYFAGQKLTANWTPYDAESFIVMVAGFARNGAAFDVEFSNDYKENAS